MNRTESRNRNWLERCSGNADKLGQVIRIALDNETVIVDAAAEVGVDCGWALDALRVLGADWTPSGTHEAKLTPGERLYRDVFARELDGDEPCMIMPDDADAVLEWVFSGAGGTLDEREADVLRRRYRDGEKLETIGNNYSCTREWIRQIQKRAIRKLQRNYNKDVLINGMDIMDEVVKRTRERKEQIIQELVYQRLRSDKDIKAAERYARKAGAKTRTPQEILEYDIERLGLSVRSYNLLKRGGCDTVKDLSCIPDLCTLRKMPGLGRKCETDIIYSLRRLGVECPITCGVFKAIETEVDYDL